MSTARRVGAQLRYNAGIRLAEIRYAMRILVRLLANLSALDAHSDVSGLSEGVSSACVRPSLLD
ncbi:hypothetical protein AB0L86_23075 [Micromonospora musae]|uniref:hypothetical protein n=1 Tax=Micromonospora musae TaxID=1894970 RepID=UPI003427CD2F